MSASSDSGAKDHLERMLESLRDRIFDARVDTSQDVHELVGATRALHAVGALSDQEYSDLAGRLSEMLKTPAELVRIGRQIAAQPGEPEGFQLERVIPGPFDGGTGNGISLVSVELYEDMVALRWNVRLEPSEKIEAQLPEFDLSDDLGTPYRLHGQRAGGGKDVLRGVTNFFPPVPREATSLEVRAVRYRFRVSLA